MAMYGIPSCSRDIEFYEPEASTVSALTVCFCCLASNTPVIAAVTCTHTEFVQQYFTEWNNQKLAICYICHYMLKKIEIFRRQVRDSLELLSDYQHTKEHNLNRPRMVNHLVATDMVITSNVKSTETTDDNAQKPPIEAPIVIYIDDTPGTSKDAGDSDDEPSERIEVATNLIEPASVVLRGNGKPRKRRKKLYTTQRQRNQTALWMAQYNIKKQIEGHSLPEKYKSKNVSTNPIREARSKTIKVKEIGSTMISLTKKSTSKNSTKLITDQIASSSNLLIEIPKRFGSTKNSMKTKTIPTILRRPYRQTEEQTKLRKEPKKNMRNCSKNLIQEKNQIADVEIFNMKGSFQITLPKKYDGMIKVDYLNQDELMQEREIERQKEFFLKKPFKCVTCIQGFRTEATYNTHKMKNHPIDRSDYEMSCDVCDTALRLQRAVWGHLKSHVLRYVCVECGMMSKNLNVMECHYKFTHVGNSVKCKDCNQTFYKRKNLMAHRKLEHKKKCSFCERAFRNASDLFMHFRKIHPDESPFTCHHCAARFENYQKLCHHRLVVHKIPVKCMKSRRNKEQNVIIIGDEMENIDHNNVEQMEIIDQDSVVQIENIYQDVGGMVNVEPEVYVPVNDDREMDNISKDSIDVVKNEHRIVEMENIGEFVAFEHNMAVLENIEQSTVEMVNNENIIVGLVNNDQNVVEMDNIEHNTVDMENNEHSIEELVNNEDNIVGVVNNGHDIVGVENFEPNTVEMENNDRNIVVLVKNEHSIEELVSNEHNIEEMKNNDPNIMGVVNNENNIAEMENIEHNNVEMENNDRNLVVLVNNENNFVELVNNDQNIVEIENIEHTAEMENIDHNTVEMENNDRNLVVLVNNENNIVELVNNDHDIVGVVNNEHSTEEMENNDPNIVGLVNNDPNVLVLVNNENQDEIIDLNNMDRYVDCNILEGKEDQSCIIGL